MLIPKVNRAKIYDALFQGASSSARAVAWPQIDRGADQAWVPFFRFLEGIMVAKKDFNAPKHMNLEDVPNLQVIKAMQSLASRGYVKVQFNWQYYYWYAFSQIIRLFFGRAFSAMILNMHPLLRDASGFSHAFFVTHSGSSRMMASTTSASSSTCPLTSSPTR